MECVLVSQRAPSSRHGARWGQCLALLLCASESFAVLTRCAVDAIGLALTPLTLEDLPSVRSSLNRCPLACSRVPIGQSPYGPDAGDHRKRYELERKVSHETMELSRQNTEVDVPTERSCSSRGTITTRYGIPASSSNHLSCLTDQEWKWCRSPFTIWFIPVPHWASPDFHSTFRGAFRLRNIPSSTKGTRCFECLGRGQTRRIRD